MKKVIFSVWVVVGLFFAGGAFAADVPELINYQGRLTDSSGKALDGSGIPMEFSLWDGGMTLEQVTDEKLRMDGTGPLPLVHQDLTPGSEVVTSIGGSTLYETPRDYLMDYPNGTISRVNEGLIPDQGKVEVDYEWMHIGELLWSESQQVDVSGGLYQTTLGLLSPLPPSVLKGSTVYLELSVDGETLSPRRRLTSVPYALNATTLSGYALEHFAQADHSHIFTEIKGIASDSQIPDDITIIYAQDAGALGGVTAGGYLMSAGDTVSGDLDVRGGVDVEGRVDVGSDLYVSGDATVMGGNIGLGTEASSNYGITNLSSTAPDFGAFLFGYQVGILGKNSWYPDNYGYFGSFNDGVYGKAGSLQETSSRYGGRFIGLSQGYAFGISGVAYGYSTNPARGVYGSASNAASGDAYGGYFSTTSGGGTEYGVFAEAEDYAAWFQNGVVHVGNGGEENHVEGDGDLYVKDEIEVDGNAYLGRNLSVGAGRLGLGRLYDSNYGIINSLDSPPYYGNLLYGAEYGVRGSYASDPENNYGALGLSRYGVYGQAGDSVTSSERYGGSFYGTSRYPSYGVSAFADGYGNSNAYGGHITGFNNTDGHAYGVYSRAYTYKGSGDAYGLYSFPLAGSAGTAYGLYVAGGTKNWVNPDPEDPEKAIAYVTVEAGENLTYCRGTAVLVDGYAEVALAEHFRKVTSPGHPVTVQVTPGSAESLGLAVTKKTNSTLVVQELYGGTGNYEFDYTVQGLRLGYEDYEPVIENVDYVPFQGNQEGMDPSEITTQEWYDAQAPGLKRIFKKNGVMDPDGKVNEKAFEARGWKLVKERAPQKERHRPHPAGQVETP